MYPPRNLPCLITHHFTEQIFTLHIPGFIGKAPVRPLRALPEILSTLVIQVEVIILFFNREQKIVRGFKLSKLQQSFFNTGAEH